MKLVALLILTALFLAQREFLANVATISLVIPF